MGYFSDQMTRDPHEPSPLWEGPDHDLDDWQPARLSYAPPTSQEATMADALDLDDLIPATIDATTWWCGKPGTSPTRARLTRRTSRPTPGSSETPASA
jgi:hypothetical protein